MPHFVDSFCKSAQCFFFESKTWNSNISPDDFEFFPTRWFKGLFVTDLSQRLGEFFGRIGSAHESYDLITLSK